MKRKIALFALVALALTFSGCSGKSTQNTGSTEIYVSAAASLNGALTEVSRNYEHEHPGQKVLLNFGGSGALQQQIEQGAPVDVFIAASSTQMDALAAKNLIDKQTRRDLLTNDLVLITSKSDNQIAGLPDLAKPGVKRIGVGSPDAVPAGKYAQESLQALNLWQSLQPKLVLTRDVTQVLSYVETGNAEAGFVYASDAKTSDKVKVVTVLDPNTHKPITYPAAVVTSGKANAAAREFLAYLQTPNSSKTFAAYGFKTLPQK